MTKAPPDTVPLLRLRTQVSELGLLEPLARNCVLGHYPARFQRTTDSDELADLQAAMA